MATRKPIICIANPKSSTGKLISQKNLGIVFNNAVGEIEGCLLDRMGKWLRGELQNIMASRYDYYLNKNLAEQLSDLSNDSVPAGNKRIH